MIGLLQRLTTAKMIVDHHQIAQIEEGLSVFIGVETKQYHFSSRLSLRNSSISLKEIDTAKNTVTETCACFKIPGSDTMWVMEVP